MEIRTIQGIVKNGQIQLSEDVKLPEMAEVYIVIPPSKNVKKIMSPRFSDRSDASRFVKTIEEDVEDEV